jgi:hypothetical protein
MEKKTLFFKDEGEMGDVLSQARGLARKVQIITKHLDTQIKEISELKEQVEEENYNQVIKENLGKKTDTTKSKFSSLISNWRGKKNEVEKEKEELQAQQVEILSQKQGLEEKQNEVNPEQQEILAKELQNISRLEEKVSEKLVKLENTKEAIENILNENKEKIRENILTNEEVEFIKLKYFSLIRSRLRIKSITSPVSNNSYYEKDWKLTLMENEIIAKTMKGIIKSHNDIYFDIIYTVPMDIEGYVYKKKGMEVTDTIKKFINSVDGESYNALVLACPTGWDDEIKSQVGTMSHSNASIYLIDLAEKQMVFNRNDEKTMNFSEWFAPLSMDDEVNDLVEKLNIDIKNGDIQFRADKVVEKYKVPRKIVISAFHKIADSKNAEIIDRSEGAKDIILLTR